MRPILKWTISAALVSALGAAFFVRSGSEPGRASVSTDAGVDSKRAEGDASAARRHAIPSRPERIVPRLAGPQPAEPASTAVITMLDVAVDSFEESELTVFRKVARNAAELERLLGLHYAHRARLEELDDEDGLTHEEDEAKMWDLVVEKLAAEEVILGKERAEELARLRKEAMDKLGEIEIPDLPTRSPAERP